MYLDVSHYHITGILLPASRLRPIGVALLESNFGIDYDKDHEDKTQGLEGCEHPGHAMEHMEDTCA